MTGLAVEADQISAGPIGLLIVLLMVIATVFLIRNMNGRLKRLPREFPPDLPREHPADGDPGAPPEQRRPR